MSEAIIAATIVLGALAMRGKAGGGSGGSGGDAAAPPPTTSSASSGHQTPAPTAERQSEIDEGESEGLRRQREGTLAAELDYAVADRSGLAEQVPAVADPRGGVRSHAVLRHVDAEVAQHLVDRLIWEQLEWTGAGIDYKVASDRRALIIAEHPRGVYHVCQLVRTRDAAHRPLRVGYWVKPSVTDPLVRPRMHADQVEPYSSLSVGQASLAVALQPWGGVRGSDIRAPRMVLRPQHVARWHTEHDVGVARPHPNGEPWECYSFRRYKVDERNGEWCWVWWSPWYPLHRSRAPGDLTLFEPHLGGGSRVHAFGEWTVELNATGDPPRGQWVGERSFGIPDGFTRGAGGSIRRTREDGRQDIFERRRADGGLTRITTADEEHEAASALLAGHLDAGVGLI